MYLILVKYFFITAVFFNKYINHYNYSVLIIFIRISFVTFPQPLWFRSTQNYINLHDSIDFIMGLKITQSHESVI